MNDATPQAQTPDFYIESQPGAPFRAELNTIIAALISSSAGSEEPKNLQAGMLWQDTSATPWTLYRRNADNTGWLKPSKGDVELGSVLNAKSDEITEDDTNKLATARAVKRVNDRMDNLANRSEIASLYAASNGEIVRTYGEQGAACQRVGTGNYTITLPNNWQRTEVFANGNPTGGRQACCIEYPSELASNQIRVRGYFFRSSSAGDTDINFTLNIVRGG